MLAKLLPYLLLVLERQILLLLLHKKAFCRTRKWRIAQLPQLLADASEAAPKSQGPTKGSPPAVSELARLISGCWRGPRVLPDD